MWLSRCGVITKVSDLGVKNLRMKMKAPLVFDCNRVQNFQCSLLQSKDWFESK